MDNTLLEENEQDCFDDCNGKEPDESCVASTGSWGDPTYFSCVTLAPKQDAWLWDDGPSAPWWDVTWKFDFLFYGAYVWHDWCYHHNPITYGQTKKDCDEISYRIADEICKHFDKIRGHLGLLTDWFFKKGCLAASTAYYTGVSTLPPATSAWNAANTKVYYGRPLSYPSDLSECKGIHKYCIKCVRYNSAHPKHHLDILDDKLFCIECSNGFWAYLLGCTETPFESEFFPIYTEEGNSVLQPSPSPSVAPTSPPTPYHSVDLAASIVCRQVGSIGNPSPRCLYSQPCSNFPLTINDPIDSINFCQHVGYCMNSSRDSTCPESDSYCWIKVKVPYDDGIGGLFLNAWTPSGVSLGDGSCVQNDGINPSGKSFINMCGNDHNNVFEPSISVGAWLAAPKGNSQVCLDIISEDTIEYGFKSSKKTCVETLVLSSNTSATNFDNDDEAECKTITTLMYSDFQPTPTEVTSACQTLWIPDSVPTKDDDVFIGGEIKCRKFSYEVQGKWVSPRPAVCGDVETAAAALDLTLTPGCSLWFWCMQEASQWIIGSDQVYVL
mmetsp:Transcript_19848/g.28231  ORF Transcript_19848/g.28231 Transcript_19848/m.28231 type:complete len:553 (+) Transcript_19848:676-2334(+)